MLPRIKVGRNTLWNASDKLGNAGQKHEMRERENYFVVDFRLKASWKFLHFN